MKVSFAKIFQRREIMGVERSENGKRPSPGGLCRLDRADPVPEVGPMCFVKQGRIGPARWHVRGMDVDHLKPVGNW